MADKRPQTAGFSGSAGHATFETNPPASRREGRPAFAGHRLTIHLAGDEVAATAYATAVHDGRPVTTSRDIPVPEQVRAALSDFADSLALDDLEEDAVDAAHAARAVARGRGELEYAALAAYEASKEE